MVSKAECTYTTGQGLTASRYPSHLPPLPRPPLTKVCTMISKAKYIYTTGQALQPAGPPPPPQPPRHLAKTLTDSAVVGGDGSISGRGVGSRTGNTQLLQAILAVGALRAGHARTVQQQLVAGLTALWTRTEGQESMSSPYWASSLHSFGCGAVSLCWKQTVQGLTVSGILVLPL